MTYPQLSFALFGNVHQTRKNQYVEAILNKLKVLGVHTLIEEKFADFIKLQLNIDITGYPTFRQTFPNMADVAISIGGDGTFLGTAAQIGKYKIPILGINTGRLGFLADVSPATIDQALESLCAEDYIIEKRKVIAIEKNGSLSQFYPYALNEVAILKHDNSSLIEITASIDGNYLTSYLADGLIVCTPTGSTGYSLSVGGPILVPESSTLCLSPVAPHSLSLRPVVVPDNVQINLEIRSRSGNFMLSADGRSESLPDSTQITIRCAAHTVQVIKINHKYFFETLREKLMWGADNRS